MACITFLSLNYYNVVVPELDRQGRTILVSGQ